MVSQEPAKLSAMLNGVQVQILVPPPLSLGEGVRQTQCYQISHATDKALAGEAAYEVGGVIRYTT